MHRNARRTLAAALALALAAGTLTAPASADAAKKPKLSKTSLALKAGKSAKVKIKNVKAKKVKKLTVKTSAKKTATVKKNGKTAFTVTGKKKGSATITAGVKVGKKTTNLKLRVKVAASTVPSKTPVPPAPSAVPPATGTQAPPAASAPATQAPSDPPSVPTATPLTNYFEDFENGLNGWYGRGNEGENGEPGTIKLELSDEAHSGSHSALITGREGVDGEGHEWNGPAIDLTDTIMPGGKYRATFYAKVPSDATTYKRGIDIMLSGAMSYSEDDETFENYPRDTWHKIPIDDWKEISVEFTVPEYFQSYILYVETHGFGKAPFLIDDFRLELVAAPVAAEHPRGVCAVHPRDGSGSELRPVPEQQHAGVHQAPFQQHHDGE